VGNPAGSWVILCGESWVAIVGNSVGNVWWQILLDLGRESLVGILGNLWGILGWSWGVLVNPRNPGAGYRGF
jgi:hypothetical protein